MPVISNLVFTVTASTIVATWNTDTSSDSNLSAGSKGGIDNGVAADSTNHQCIVTGLSPSTVYSCYVTSGGTSSTPQNVQTGASPSRTVITNASFSGTRLTSSLEGDTYYNFVSSDGNTYVTQDDGTGFVNGSPNSGSNMQIGQWTNQSTLTGVNVNALSAYGAIATSNGSDGPSGHPLSNKLSGLFGLNGHLFAFQERQDQTDAGSGIATDFFGNIMMDDANHGATWNSWQTPSTFSASGVPPDPLGSYMFANGNIGIVTPVRYAADDGTLGYLTPGNGIDGANGWVYAVYNTSGWTPASNLYLMRMPRIQFAAQSTTGIGYWAGPSSPTPADFVNDSNWAETPTGATAILSSPSKLGICDLIFLPQFNTYLLLTWYYSIPVGTSVWNIYSGTTPAGPWTNVLTLTSDDGYYNPVVMHSSALAITSTKNVALQIVYTGNYLNSGLYVATTGEIMLNPTLVAHTIGAGGQEGCTTPAINTTGATFLVAFVTWYNVTTDTPTFSDSVGGYSNVWTKLTTYSSTTDSCAVWYCIPTYIGSGHTFTTGGNMIYANQAIQAFSNVLGIFEGGSDQGNTNLATKTIQPGNVTPINGYSSLVICGLDWASAATTISINDSFTISDQIPYDSGVTDGMAFAYLVTSNPVNPTWSSTATPVRMTSPIAVFTANSGGGQGNSPLGNVIFDLDSDGFPIAELQTGTNS